MKMNSAPFEQLKKTIAGRCSRNVKLAPLTSWKIGGPADIFVQPGNIDELEETLKISSEFSIPLFVLGNGSNLLISDEGVRGIVIKMGGDFNSITVEKSRITAGASAILSLVVNEASRNGLTGLEFLAGIPGTVGGAVFMNAGSTERGINDYLKYVDVLTFSGKRVRYSSSDLKYGYRWTLFPEKCIITGVAFNLNGIDPEKSRQMVIEYLGRKRSTQPIGAHTAGCVFKNPPGILAGKIIDDLGLKGTREGDAEISRLHANHIINKGNATFRNILDLINRVQHEVFVNTGEKLTLEIKIIGKCSDKATLKLLETVSAENHE